MVETLVALAILEMVGGMLGLTTATMGVGAIAGACLFGIFARMAQSRRQHRELLDLIASQRPEPQRLVQIGGPWECGNCGQRNSQQMRACTLCHIARPVAM